MIWQGQNILEEDTLWNANNMNPTQKDVTSTHLIENQNKSPSGISD